MMNRREALAAIAAALLSGAATSSGAAADTLNQDLARLAKRVYSEQGIPMFLACVNSARPAAVANALRQNPFNHEVASAFQRYTGEWLQANPKAPVDDVARIVELMADRDVKAGGREASL